MDAMKLWSVTLTHELVVRAETEHEAQIAALDALDDGLFDDWPAPGSTRRVFSVADLPPTWDGGCLPYGERHPQDLTIAEQLRETENAGD